jgi:hypothetical protein
MAAVVSAHSPKLAIEPQPPSLELDLGYSIIEARPSIKLKISLGAFSRRTHSDRFSLSLRKWWVRWQGRADGKAEIMQHQPQISTAFEEEIARERFERINNLSATAELDVAEARKAIEALRPVTFLASDIVHRIQNQALSWLRLFKEHLAQARDNLSRSEAAFKEADQNFDAFVEQRKIGARRPPDRQSIWDRVAGLAAMVIVEALLSLPAVAEHQDGRLVLSFLYPLSVSVGNAMLGVLTGAIALYLAKHSEQAVVRALAIAGCLGSLVIAAWMNLAVARWREGSDPTTSLTTLLPETALSMVLLVIGFTVYVFAIYKGLGEFSPGYPGHDEKWDELVNSQAEYEYWRDRYLHLVHEMRRTTQEKLDGVRSQLTDIRNQHEKRKKQATHIVIDLQALQRILPGSYRLVNDSTCILLKLYRQAGYLKRRARGDAQCGLVYVETRWPTALPDVAAVKLEADDLSTAIGNNIKELSRFEERFERDIAAEMHRQIEQISSEARVGPA